MTGPEWESQEGFYEVTDCLNTKGGKAQEGETATETRAYLKSRTPENLSSSFKGYVMYITGCNLKQLGENVI